jgi:predicted TIM-barrel fold metal-dependent hydrolase
MIQTQTTPPTPFRLPAGAVDAHVHLFDPARFAFAAQRSYTPAAATLDGLRERHAALGIDRAVLVQPSVYGSDNRCLLDGLRRGGADRLRGIAVLDLEQAAPEALQSMHAAGVRGIRLNLEVRREHDPERVRRQLERAARVVHRPDWCVQLHVAAEVLPVVEALASAFAVPLVLDHFGGLRAGDAADRSGRLAPLLRLLAGGRVYVKLSAFYRASSQAPHHADLAPLAQALIGARPDRLLWGSDWPHTGGGGAAPRDPGRVEPFRAVDLAAGLAALRAWCPDAAVLRRILVDNPAALYGFAAATPFKEMA